MPTYDFKCDCGYEEEKFIQLSFDGKPVKVTNELNKKLEVNCPKCKKLMYQVFNPYMGVHWKGEAPLGMQSKNRREADKTLAIYREGFTCQSEIKESMDMAKEEEKKRGLTAGSLVGNRNSLTKEEQKKKSTEKIAASRKKRGARSWV